MKFAKRLTLSIFLILISIAFACRDDKKNVDPDMSADFIFGSDLSSTNQLLDHNAVFKDQNEVRSPYRIFKDNGNKLVRLRLWHHPTWTKDVYGASGTQLYNDLADVVKAAASAKEQGMQVLLDFHYSDTWADPGKQYIPDAWKNIQSLSVLKDSVYNYTLRTLRYMQARNVIPDQVQIGNEINCGMFITDTPAGFPQCNVCNENWATMGEVLNSGIKAVRDASPLIKILLHVADPKNIDWWFGNMTTKGKVTDYDIIGFSYYPLWHTTISPDQLTSTVSAMRTKYSRPLMILETAYPWTTQNADSYANIFGSQAPLTGYPFTPEGQDNLMKSLAQKMIDGGGVGMVYWEPAWITSDAKDLWGTGSSWENNAYFDFNGNYQPSVDFMKITYTKK